MSDDEKPLHVQVAEAIGWTDIQLGWVFGRREWCGTSPARANGWDGHGRMQIPRYDQDWHATGPLIERYSVDLRHARQALMWWAGEPGGILTTGCYEGPLPAVCRLIVLMHREGKLPL